MDTQHNGSIGSKNLILSAEDKYHLQANIYQLNYLKLALNNLSSSLRQLEETNKQFVQELFNSYELDPNKYDVNIKTGEFILR